MKGKHYTIAVFCFMLLWPQLLLSAVYTWVDEKGVTHYSDQPVGTEPLKIELDQVQTYNLPASQRNKSKRVSDLLEHNRKEKEQVHTEELAREKGREQQCQRSKKQLKVYQEAGYLYEEDDQGNKKILSKEQRVEALTKATQMVEHWCKK
jgi:hypothetical protein